MSRTRKIILWPLILLAAAAALKPVYGSAKAQSQIDDWAINKKDRKAELQTTVLANNSEGRIERFIDGANTCYVVVNKYSNTSAISCK